MVVTISCKDYNLIDDCEDESLWSGATVGNVTDFFKEGTQCVGFELWGSGDTDVQITVVEDLSGITHLRFWMMTTVLNELNTDANGGIQVYLSDGANTGYWYVSGSTSYPGGWYNIVCDLSRAVDSGTKPTMTAITTVGIRFNLTSGAKKVQSLWIDHVYTGSGLIAYGDDGGGSFDYNNILDADENTTNGWGILRNIGGVFYSVGSITIGDNVGTNSTDFQATNDILIFEERAVGSSINIATTLYEIACVGNGTGTTSIKFGDLSGTSGISGCVIKAIDANRSFKFTATDINIETLGLYATIFDLHGIIDLMVNSSTREVLGCSFVNSPAQIQPSTMTFKSNFIISGTSADGSVLFESTSHNMEYNNYINCSRATEFAVADTYSIIGDQFTGNTYDVHFSAVSGDLIINAGGTPPANPSPAKVENDSSGTVTINNTVTITITVKDSGGTEIENARVYIEADTGGDLPAEESITSIVRSGSTCTVTHTGHGLASGQRVNIEGANEHDYNGVHTITVTGVDEYEYTIAGTPDSPATGTLTCTFVMIEELTNASGIATEEFDYSSSQPFKAWIRKSSGSPYFKDSEFTGSITSSGFVATVTLVSDE